MKQAGAVVLFRFPQTNLEINKPRPALLLGKLHGKYSDWLVCMISSQIKHYQSDVDELIRAGETDFTESGLHNDSVIRVERLAVMDESSLLGEIGAISPERLRRIKDRLINWLAQ
jgi:mRNA interferase MazF